nr:hypothetical protein [Tanacetum cinerariifolium]
MIVESIHIHFDEIKEVYETSVANDTSGLVPQRQKASDYDNSDPGPQLQNVSSSVDAHVTSQQELDLLFGPLYDEFFNEGFNPQDKQPTTNIQPTSAPTTPTYVHAEENNNDQAEEDHLPDDEFTNPFCAPTQEVAESSSHNTGNSNVPTFNQPQVSKYRWTKDHPLEQVHGNPSRPVQTRRQLATDPEMCMFALTVSTAEPKNIKEAMDDFAWIKAMQEELHQFDRLQGRMPTKIELTLEQSQQGVSNDVLVSIEGVEELKRNVWIKGENKVALSTLKAEIGSIHMLSVFTKVNSVKIEILLEPTLIKLLVGLDDDVAASFQRSRIHHHMLMLKLQRHTKHQDSRIKKALTQRQRLPQTLINKIFLQDIKSINGDC